MNPLLARLNRGLAAHVPPSERPEFGRLVSTGAKQLFGKDGKQQIVEHCKGRDDLPEQVALLATSVPELYFPPDRRVMVAHGGMAAFTLMSKVLEFAERKCGHVVTPDLIEAATNAAADALLARMHLSIAKIAAAAAQDMARIAATVAPGSKKGGANA